MRLDGARVVVALDAHGHGDAVACVDHARVLAWADEHPWRLGGQAAEMGSGRLVRAVLGPHNGIHRQLELVRLATQDALDGHQLVVGEPEGAMKSAGGQHGLTVSEGSLKVTYS